VHGSLHQTVQLAPGSQTGGLAPVSVPLSLPGAGDASDPVIASSLAPESAPIAGVGVSLSDCLISTEPSARKRPTDPSLSGGSKRSHVPLDEQ
jgi:hypothetical protein